MLENIQKANKKILRKTKDKNSNLIIFSDNNEKNEDFFLI